jgi:hypothetical protein
MRAIFRLFHILSIKDVGVGDECKHPFSGQTMSFSDRSTLRQTLINEWLAENGLVRRL